MGGALIDDHGKSLSGVRRDALISFNKLAAGQNGLA
jgi:hypothetical protein